MSRRTVDRNTVATLEQAGVRLSQRTVLLTIAVSLGLMAALAFDMLSGNWITDAPLHLALSSLAVLLVLPFARRTARLHFGVLYVFGLFVYTVLRGFADHTAIPVHTLYVINIDRALGFGITPSQWLQARLFHPGRLRLLDWLAVQVHWSYFLLPHAGALLVYLRRRELFPRYVAQVLGTFYAGLVLYFLLPTVPPWLAADNGMLPGVARIMDYVGGQVNPATYQRAYDALAVPNPVAAMPSLHMGVTFAVTLFAWRLDRRLGAVLLVYAIVMGFSLIYLGEHYLSDVLMGVLVATLVNCAVRRWMDAHPHHASAAPA